MAFPPEFLDELRARISLADIVGRRVKLIRRGREHTGLCPFHKEKSPSFTLNEDKGFYHCFGCGVHGSAFDFVMETEGLSFPEAVERLAAEAGMQPPKRTPEDRAKAERAKSLADVCEMAAVFFERTLRTPEGRQGLEYLRGRGVAEDTIAGFRLGFAPDGAGGGAGGAASLRAHLAREGVSDALMIEAGLTVQPEDDSRTPYDRFRGRVIFPITDPRGRVVAFGGRALSDKGPKYLNSPETPLFHKGHMLYGLHQAQGPARLAGQLIVAEGYMDVIALAEGGFAQAVAPLGTALTEDQLRMLWRVVDGPVLCFDGDNAGRRAAGRAAERALGVIQAGKGLRFAELPPGDDPDTLIRAKGRDAFADVLARALPLSEVIWRMETGGGLPRDPESRAAVQRRIDGHVRAIQDPAVRRHMGQAFRDRMWRAGRQDYEKGAGGGGSGRGGGAGRGGFRRGREPVGVDMDPALVRGGAVVSEEEAKHVLLAATLAHPEVLDLIEDTLGALTIADAGPEALRGAVLRLCAETPGLGADDLRQGLAAEGLEPARARFLADERLRSFPALREGGALHDVIPLARANAAVLARDLTRFESAAAGAEAGTEDAKAASTPEAQEAAWTRLLALKRAEFSVHEDERAED
ncbi:MAG: DNA primase [Rhodospirillales bacterium]